MPKIKVKKMPGGWLIPVTPEDKNAVQQLPNGQFLEMEYKTPRNYEFHKKFFALLNMGFEYWTPGGGTVSPGEKSYLAGFIRFLATYVDHRGTLEEFSLAYSELVAERRADGVEVAKSFEHFRKWVTVEAGWYDECVFPDGTKRREARSISFAKMGQAEFVELYKSAFNVLWNYILRHSFETMEEAENVAYQLLDMEC